MTSYILMNINIISDTSPRIVFYIYKILLDKKNQVESEIHDLIYPHEY